MRNRVLGLALATFIVGSPAESQETPGGQPDWLSQAKIAAQLEGISVGEAVRRARLQNLAIKQGERFAADPDFAGSWIERGSSTFRIIFAFKGNAQRTIADPDLAGASQTTAVRYSIKDLQTERQRLGQSLATAGLTASYIVRAKENDLVVYPSDATKLRALISSGSLTVAPFVKIENGPLIVSNQALVQGGGPTTGTRVVNGVTYTDLCTAAFTVTTGGTGSGGTRGISTAGHLHTTQSSHQFASGTAHWHANGLPIWQWRRCGVV